MLLSLCFSFIALALALALSVAWQKKKAIGRKGYGLQLLIKNMYSPLATFGCIFLIPILSSLFIDITFVWPFLSILLFRCAGLA